MTLKDSALNSPQLLDEAKFELEKIKSNRGPGNALFLKFANFADRVAYWTGSIPSELVVSDLGLKSPVTLFVDSDGKYKIQDYPYPNDEIELIWSPDDLHLIVNVPADKKLNLIYDMNTGLVNNWPYKCETIARSPRTSMWALWCLGDGEGNAYAIIEWGGNIWYTNMMPDEILVSAHEEFRRAWKWSSDGENIAYYDPEDADGFLYIANQRGERKKLLPASAFWLAQSHPVFLPPEDPLQWSSDGTRLLIYALGESDDACPNWYNIFGESSNSIRVPCWQVLELSSEKMVWRLATSAQELASSQDPKVVEAWSYYNASISPDGRVVALAGINGGLDKLHIVNVDNGEVTSSLDISLGPMRWVSMP